jgi:chromosome segregation ATPase
MMDEQMEVMEQRGGRSDPRLEAENEELKIRAEQAERRLAEQRDELAVTQEQLDRAKRDVRDEKSKTEVALQKAKHAEDDVKELVEQIAAERQKNVRAAKDDNLAGSRLQQRNQDVARYQKENKLLADENDRMNMRIEDLMAECVEMSETIVKLDDAAQAWRGREADVEAAADGLRRERDKLAAQLETTKMDLEERTHLLQDLEIKFKEEYERFEREKEDLMIDAKRARHGEGVDGARGFDAGSGRSDLVSPRRRMQITRDPRRPANPDDPRYVEDLEAEVAELRDLRVLLLEAYDQLEHDVGREIDIALKRQRRQHDALHDKLAAQDEALDIETKRFRSIDKELTHAQEDLAEANERCKKYEAGVYGLSDAMRDLKQTRLRVRAADAQVEDAVALSNQLGRKVEDLIEETRYLRQKAGIPEDATLDLGGFKLKSQVESAQMRALNAQLEREVADLEEDRRRLRNELRYRAKWQGEHAARLGLSARQLGMLEEYADALRYGDDALFNDADDAGSHPGFRASQGIGARAIRELEDANKTLQQRLAEALDRLQRGETGAGGISMPLIAAGSYGGGDHSQVAELQSQLARARAEIVRLEDGYNVAMMRSSVQGALVGSGGGGGVASVAASPAAAARAPDSPPRGAATAAAAAAAAAAPGAAVDASAYAEALETIDRLRGERNALHARAQSLQSMIDAAPATMGVGASGVVAGVGGADYGASTDVQKMREECVAADRALAGVVAELQTKERELDELAHETAKYKTGIAELQAVRTALYREHVRARNAWSEERKTLLERAKRAETEAEANRIEAKDATALCERLKPGAESGLKEALSAAHSRLAVLQVREVRLSRAVEAATSAEASFRAEKEELEIDVQEMSRACQERLAFHERRAAEAELRAARCQRELDLCVPRPEHAAVVDANRALQVRFKELLETRVKSAVSSAQLKAAQEDAVTARAQADAASAANAAAQNRVRELSAALDDAADRAGREGLAASAVELRREVAETRAELEASKRLADLAKRESERLTESKADLESAVLGLEHQARSIQHWSPYDRVGVVNADP